MNTNPPRTMTILFADISGSTILHSQLGDLEAHLHISSMLEHMSFLITAHHGRVIETIGDEIMCAFENTDNALNAACAIQESSRRKSEPGPGVRIGLHCGLTNEENGHPYGDTVNIAARVVSIARAGQIMLTDHVFQQLGKQNQSSTHHFSSLHLKGKQAPYAIRQASWEKGSETRLVECASHKPMERRTPATRLCLRSAGPEVTVIESGAELLLGRGEQCDLRVDTNDVSRIHAILKFERGKMSLADRSTNGTFIRTREGNRSEDNQALFLHHDEWITSCGGVVSLGKPISDTHNNLIYISRFQA